MTTQSKIDINIFKVVTRAIAASDNLNTMADHLTQLLVGALEIKGCNLFALNADTRELEILASFGMSMAYINKGPLVVDKSIGCIKDKESVVITDIKETDLLQYPKEAMEEGIRSIIAVPIVLYGETIGSLRLYHHEPWEISVQDLDSLKLLAENVGLAMMYTRLLNAMTTIKETVTAVPLEGMHS